MTRREPTGSEWCDPEVFAVDKCEPRTTSRSVASLEGDGSETWRSLDGSWRFKWVPSLREIPRNHWERDFDDSLWDPVAVPGNWELAGYGNLIYAPANLPRSLRGGSPPDIDVDDSPVGCYRRMFELPVGWTGRRVTLLFGGVSSAMYLWVNGTWIGYSQGSRTPAEFDITEAVVPGANQLAVQVHRWCDGSYLENQDMWFLSGIFRSVELRSEPPVSLHDVTLTTSLDATYRHATLDVVAEHRRHATTGAEDIDSVTGWSVTVNVERDGRTIAAGSKMAGATERSGGTADGAPGVTTVRVDVGDVPLWTSETPELVDVEVSLVDPDGIVVDRRRMRHGFRTIEVRGRQLLINGVPVTLLGVNRHDLDPVTGSTMTAERLRTDVELMKLANINAVRTAHYPDDERFYDLCDEMGLYVLDETDMESHAARRTVPASDPKWRDACVDRARRMVVRDRNHACVIMWSLGNEAGFGANHSAMADAVRSLDPTRPIHYEGDHHAIATDVWSAMYATPSQLRKAASGRRFPLLRTNLAEQIWHGLAVSEERLSEVPVMLCEYAHCMGNSLGNLEEYVEIFRTYDGCLGGFIWDFADQGLRHELGDGTTMWARGGDLTDEFHFGSVCANGIVSADRTPHPAYHQVAALYSGVGIRVVARDVGSAVCIENRYAFRSLAGLECRTRYTADGDPLTEWASSPLFAEPGSSDEIEAGEPPDADGEAEMRLEIEVVLSEDTPWGPKGHVVGRTSEYQPTASRSSSRRPAASRTRVPAATTCAPPSLVEEADRFQVDAAGVSVEINRRSGELDSWTVSGREFLESPITPNLWRAQIDNEIAAARAFSLTRDRDLNPWRLATDLRRLLSTSARRVADGSIELTSRWIIPGGVGPFTILWRVDRGGNLDVEASFRPLFDLPRMGITFEVVSGFDTFTWFGRGPHETMWDRKSGAAVGRYRADVAELTHDYLRPQENGNRTDVRWAKLTDQRGAGVCIADAGGDFLEMTARPYRQAELADVSHHHLLQARPTTTVTIDWHQRGVGGDIPAGVSTIGLHRDFKLRRLRTHRVQCCLSPL